MSRAELFERVWSEPVERIANHWGISDRGLGKVCALHIPVPPRGYWAKAQHGKRPGRPQLRDLALGEAEQIIHLPIRDEASTGR